MIFTFLYFLVGCIASIKPSSSSFLEASSETLESSDGQNKEVDFYSEGSHFYSERVSITLKALESIPAEVSLFFFRLIHSRLGMPLKAPAGMVLMLLPAGRNIYS